ncbi:MAG: hypothetical protein AB1410_08610 [Acidobacteriota bacterium]
MKEIKFFKSEGTQINATDNIEDIILARCTYDECGPGCIGSTSLYVSALQVYYDPAP